MTLQRQSKENAGAAREGKDHSSGKALMPCSNSMHSQNKGPCPSENQRGVSQLQSTAPGQEKQVEGQRQKARGRYGKNPRDCNYHQAISSHRSLCTSSWEPEWLSSAKGPTAQDHLPWGHAQPTSECGDLPQGPDHCTAGDQRRWEDHRHVRPTPLSPVFPPGLWFLEMCLPVR